MSVCDEILEARSALKTRKVNVIHRTTSETIRLGEPDLLINNCTSKTSNILCSRKKPVSSSFQVTGISITQRPEFGDDSADDLDESHTDDTSRITDNETPSFSEESFSRDTEEVPIKSPVVPLDATHHILPLSPCCELALVATESFEITTVEVGEIQELSVFCSEITDNSSEFNLESVLSKMTTTTTYAGQCVRIVGGRFKVVKIETAEPFKRGRWSCLDYLDQSISINPHILKTQHMHLIITDPVAYYSNASNNTTTITTGQFATETKFNSEQEEKQSPNASTITAEPPAEASNPLNILNFNPVNSGEIILTESQPNKIITCEYIEGQIKNVSCASCLNRTQHNLIQPQTIPTASTVVSASQNYRVSTKIAESLVTQVCQSHLNQSSFQSRTQTYSEINQGQGNLPEHFLLVNIGDRNIPKIDKNCPAKEDFKEKENISSKMEQNSIFHNTSMNNTPNVNTGSNITISDIPASHVSLIRQQQVYGEQNMSKSITEGYPIHIPLPTGTQPDPHLYQVYGKTDSQLPRPQQQLRSAYSLPTGSSTDANLVGQPTVTIDSSSSTGASFTFHDPNAQPAFNVASTTSSFITNLDRPNQHQGTSQAYYIQAPAPSSQQNPYAVPSIQQIYQTPLVHQDLNPNNFSQKPLQSFQIYPQELSSANSSLQPSIRKSLMQTASPADIQKCYQLSSQHSHPIQQDTPQFANNNLKFYTLISTPTIQHIPVHQNYSLPINQNQTFATQNYTANSEHHICTNQNNQINRRVLSETYQQPNVPIEQPSNTIERAFYQNPSVQNIVLTQSLYQNPALQKTSPQPQQSYVIPENKPLPQNEITNMNNIRHAELPVLGQVTQFPAAPPNTSSKSQEFLQTYPNYPSYQLTSPIQVQNNSFVDSPIQMSTKSIQQTPSNQQVYEQPTIQNPVNPIIPTSSIFQPQETSCLQSNNVEESNIIASQNTPYIVYLPEQKESTAPVKPVNVSVVQKEPIMCIQQVGGACSLTAIIEEDDSYKEKTSFVKEIRQESIILEKVVQKAEPTVLEGVCPSQRPAEIAVTNVQDAPLAVVSTPDGSSPKSNRFSTESGISCANNANAAIDNKIEKAMDLVKSHLMYTVREEVDVLKEKIVELMDRINQLEIENNYLKANVSPEVLNALNNGAAIAMAEKENNKSHEIEDGQKREQ